MSDQIIIEPPSYLEANNNPPSFIPVDEAEYDFNRLTDQEQIELEQLLELQADDRSIDAFQPGDFRLMKAGNRPV